VPHKKGRVTGLRGLHAEKGGGKDKAVLLPASRIFGHEVEMFVEETDARNSEFLSFK